MLKLGTIFLHKKGVDPLTAQQDKETCIKSLGFGAKDFLSKPFNQVKK